MRAGKLVALASIALASACPAGGQGSTSWLLTGTARMEGDGVILTDSVGGTGSAWSLDSIDATFPFRMRFTCFFGGGEEPRGGRTSLLFAQSPIDPGDIPVTEYAGIEVRTDGPEQREDSIALILGGRDGVARTVQVLPAGNLDNGLVHSLSISWDPERGRLFVWLDGMEEPVLASFERDFFSRRFPDPNALRWGFCGSTGSPGGMQWFRPDTSWVSGE
jgi:hypothetical protein